MTIIECVLALMVLTVVVRIVWGTDERQAGERLVYLGILFFTIYLPGCTPTKPVTGHGAIVSMKPCPVGTYLLGSGQCSQPIVAGDTVTIPGKLTYGTGFTGGGVSSSDDIKEPAPDASDMVFDKAMSDLRDSSERLGVALRERDESLDQLDVALGQLHDAAVQLNEELTKLQHELDAPVKEWLAPNIITTCNIGGVVHPASDCLYVGGDSLPISGISGGGSISTLPTIPGSLPTMEVPRPCSLTGCDGSVTRHETCEEMVERVSRESHITLSVNCLKSPVMGTGTLPSAKGVPSVGGAP